MVFDKAKAEINPLARTTGKNAPLGLLCGGSAATKNVGADSISARARLRQDKPPRAHIECAPTDFAFDKGRKLRAGHRPLRGGSARHKKRRGGFHIRPCPLAVRQTSAGAYRMRPYGSRFRPKGENFTRGTASVRGAPPLRISLSTSALPVLGDTTKKESVTSKMSQTLGARYRTRTCDLLHVKQMLYQLS